MSLQLWCLASSGPDVSPPIPTGGKSCKVEVAQGPGKSHSPWRFTLGSGKEKEHKLKLLGPDMLRWGGDLPRQVGWGQKLWYANPCFFRFPCFFCFAIFLAFLCVFPFFSRDFKGSAERKVLAVFGGSSLFKQKSRDWTVWGLSSCPLLITIHTAAKEDRHKIGGSLVGVWTGGMELHFFGL